MGRLKKLRKPLFITLIVCGVLVLLAVLLGVLNAVLGDGEWTFFWTDYRYDDSGYTVGSGTVYSDDLTSLDVDWIDGSVEIVICEDTYPSVSERVSGDVSESDRMRFYLDEDGRMLRVKYRASSLFLGNGEKEQKNLIVRIPERMLPQMEELRLRAATASVTVEAIPFSRIELEGRAGNVSLAVAPDTEQIVVHTRSGDVSLFVEPLPSCSLRFATERGGAPLLDVPHEREGERFVCGEGKTAIDVETVDGELTVKKKK